MAYINYNQSSVGGKQLAECMGQLQAVADQLRNLTAWMGEIGGSNLETNADFGAGSSEGQGLADTVTQINADMLDFMTANREKIERLARGS